MFCYQYEEIVKGTGCTIKGVCGTKDEIAAIRAMPVTLSGLSPHMIAQAGMACLLDRERES